MVIRFRCPNGHVIAAAPRQTGQRGHCPKCQSPVIVPHPDTNAAVTDDAALALLGEYIPKDRRLPETQPDMRSCPRCDALVLSTSRICEHCHVYLN